MPNNRQEDTQIEPRGMGWREGPQIDFREWANCEIYQNGKFLCKLLPFVHKLQQDFNNADPSRKLYEEHLQMCQTARLVEPEGDYVGIGRNGPSGANCEFPPKAAFLKEGLSDD